MNLVGFSRTITFRLQPEEKLDSRRYLLYLFVFLFVGFGLFSWQGWYSFLPMIGMVAETIGLWMKRPFAVRAVNLFPRPCWLLYNIIVGSYAGMATEMFLAVSIVIGIIRHDIKKEVTKSI